MSEGRTTVAQLRKMRPRNHFLRLSAVISVLLIVLAWMTGGFVLTDVFSRRRLDNLARFLGELQPEPFRDGQFEAQALGHWVWSLLKDHGLEATFITLAISVAAIVLAGLGALLVALPTARNVASSEPFLPAGRRPSWTKRALWQSLLVATRVVLIFLRSIPEYVWAFVLLAMLGPGAWPAVLALALHNMGILGKLGGEVIENTEPATAKALRGLGSTRSQIASVNLLPAALPRFLLYFFHRWETCVREATVLGILGFASLGYWIHLDARARNRYDQMVFYVLLAAALVLAGDLVSAAARRVVRRAA